MTNRRISVVSFRCLIGAFKVMSEQQITVILGQLRRMGNDKLSVMMETAFKMNSEEVDASSKEVKVLSSQLVKVAKLVAIKKVDYNMKRPNPFTTTTVQAVIKTKA